MDGHGEATEPHYCVMPRKFKNLVWLAAAGVVTVETWGLEPKCEKNLEPEPLPERI